MPQLIIITSEFPYYSGEPFLSNELPYLSCIFKKIYIFPTNGNNNDIPTRNIPQNATVFPLENTVSNGKYPRYIVKGIVKKDSDLSIKENSIQRIVSSLYIRGRAYSIAEQIYRYIRQNSFSDKKIVIYSFWFTYQATAAWLLSKKLNKKGYYTYAVSRAHGYDLYWERAVGGFLPFQEASLKNLKYCFPCSEFGRKYLLEKYPWAEKKIKTSRLGTRDFGLNKYGNEKTFLTCCNLEPLKRMKLFSEAFCEIAKDDKRIKWICIGSGEEETQIKSIVDNAKLNNQVVMTGRLSNDQVMEIYKKEGIMYFCNVSMSEGLPVSIMEAMSFGIPIIATNVGGTHEIVDEKNGVLLSAQIDTFQLVCELKALINESKEDYIKKRNESRKKWEQLCSAEFNYNLFCDDIVEGI